MSNIDFDITIVGGGVIGLSISYHISKLIPNIRILLIEKEKRIGLINSSRNTEVIHAGIYYQKDSMKSIFCKEGKNKIYKFCEKYKIKSKKIGKLFIDNSNNSIENLLMIQKQAKSNGLNDTKIGRRNIPNPFLLTQIAYTSKIIFTQLSLLISSYFTISLLLSCKIVSKLSFFIILILIIPFL